MLRTRDRQRSFCFLTTGSKIEFADADLTLLEELPLRATTLHRHVVEDSEIEDFLVFRGDAGMNGYILTSRRTGGSFSDETMLEMRQARLFYAYARQQPLTLQHNLNIGTVRGFLKDHLHTVGHYTTAPDGKGPGTCFLARFGMLLAAGGHSALPPAAIDTVVEVAICGERVDAHQLVSALRRTAIEQ